MQEHNEDLSPFELNLHDKRPKVSKESEEENEKVERGEDLETKKAQRRFRRSEWVKDALAIGMIVIIGFLVVYVIFVTGSLVWHYAYRPHLSDVNAEVLKGAIASFTILNAALIITKTIDLD